MFKRLFVLLILTLLISLFLSAYFTLPDVVNLISRGDSLDKDQAIKVSRNLPEAFIVYQGKTIEKKEFENILENDPTYFNFREIALFSPNEKGLKDRLLSLPYKNSNPEDLVQITEKGVDSTTYLVKSENTGLLILLKPYDFFFHATLDNLPASIYRANFAYTALLVPAGTHIVNLTYDKTFPNIGMIITLVTIVITGSGIIIFVLNDKI